MTSAPNSQNSRMENLIMAAEMQSNKQTAQTISFYLNESPPIPMPKNKSELEIYKLLERANLLQYFPTFLKHGGDDIVQLAEAEEDEEEFLEYVKLFGMHRKPLHVRRFQKELVRWKEDKLSAQTVENGVKNFCFYPNSSTTATIYADHHQANSSALVAVRGDTSVNSDRTCCSSSLVDESFGRTSTVSRSLFKVTNDNNNQTTRSDTPQQQQYLAPHEIIRNAPKRPRLMDSIMPSDLTKGLVYDSSVHSTPVRPTYFRGRGLRLKTRNLNSESQPTTPTEKRHPSIQISPPDSEELDTDDSSGRAKNLGRTRRKAVPTKSKIN